MAVDPGDWLPIIIFAFIGGCTVAGMAGAWAVGRARGLAEAARQRMSEGDTHERLARMEQALVTVSEEMERLGEIQRFALKTIADRQLLPEQSQQPERPSRSGRVITPH
jgi:hypothetical protein